MIMSHEALLKRIHDTKAVSVWNQKVGPVFWYTAGVPGPFFVNTEYLIGRETADSLISSITDILEKRSSPSERAELIRTAVLAAYDQSVDYQNLIETMADTAFSSLPPDAYSLVSGGERRDWLFSIPFAKQTGKRHVFLFKDRTFFCGSPLMANEKALHIADLINNAASYTEKWLPALDSAGISTDSTLVVTVRGLSGKEILEKRHIRVLALNTIDLDFFKKWMDIGLIDKSTYDELDTHFRSPKDWAEKYVMGREDLLDSIKNDVKSIERARSFFTKDPWGLSAAHATYFAKAKEALR